MQQPFHGVTWRAWREECAYQRRLKHPVLPLQSTGSDAGSAGN